MRTATPKNQADQIRHLSENLISQLTEGREWATPGVEAALKRVVAGLDAGIESASPRIQTGLRRLADDLAGWSGNSGSPCSRGPETGCTECCHGTRPG